MRALLRRCCRNVRPTPLPVRSVRLAPTALPLNRPPFFSSSACEIQNAGNYNFDWEEAFEEKDKKDEISSVPGLTSRLSRHLIKLPYDANVASVLDQWIEEGNLMPKNMVVVALTNLKRHRRYKQALEVANFVRRKNLFPHDDTDHMYRLYFTGQVGSIEEVERCFAEVPENHATEKVYNQLISCYMARGLIAEAEQAFQRLLQSGHPVSALVYCQLLAFYRKMGQDDRAFQLLKEMNEANVKPDTKTYNILIHMGLKQGDNKKAIALYDAMKEAGVPPDSVTYTMAIKAYVSLGMETEAFDVTNEMINRTSRDHLLENDLLIAVYADLGKEKELKLLWSHIQSSSKLSARTYGVMIESLGKLGLIQEAVNLASKVERIRGKLVTRVVNALLYVFARHGRMAAAEELMMQVTKQRLRPSAVTYSHLISGYLNVVNIEKALEYLKISREGLTCDQSRPWYTSFLLVLNYVAMKGDSELTEQIFETFTSAGYYRSTSVYNVLLKAYLNSNRPPKNFVQRMSDDGVQPDHETHAMLVQLSNDNCEDGAG